ncbi:MAG TPA: YceI family protein [Gemmatimonadales bacterium]|nr:YceI family protein [Gemmatimonadales bacterium]
MPALRPATVLPLLVVVALPLPAPPGWGSAIDAEKFDVDFAHSEIGFSIRFMGLTNVRGRFKEYAGTIMYVDKDVAKSTVSVLIQAKSIDTGTEFRDRDLRGPSFFNVDSFPTILFQSTRIDRTGSGFVARGPFTLRGVTREIAIPFTQMHGKMKDAWGNTRIGFAGSLRLDRTDYGITGSNFWNQFVDLTRMALADTVEIDLTVEGIIWNFSRRNFPARPGTKSLAEALNQTLDERGLDAALARYRELQRDTATYSTGEAQLNTLGYKLLQAGKVAEAIAMFQLNVESFPQSSNVYDSLGEAYLAKGDRTAARSNYQKALAMNPQNVGAMEVLRWLN